jgi:putative tRNA adenosine deaminase-associated protein
VTYFAAAMTRSEDAWTGAEFDLEDLDDLEAVTDALRDLADDGGGPVVLLLEEDDEYVAILRVDAGSVEDPQVFLSDRRAVLAGGAAARLWEDDLEEPVVTDDEDEENDTRPIVEPLGDASLLADLGVPADRLLELCSEEGLLPADVLTAVAEKGGFLDALDALREA